jgi:hemoglobin
MTERLGVPHDDARQITEGLIRDVVVEFYRRAQRDEALGPVFEHYIHDWDHHLDRMTDFWGAALLRTGRYSGRPVERHRGIEELTGAHFRRWVELFEATVHDLCTPEQAQAFVTRARLMREGMVKVLRLDD